VFAEVLPNINTYETQVLNRGKTYYFSVRPVNENDIENPQTNKVVQVMLTDTITTKLKASIKEPSPGKKIYGDQTTISADILVLDETTNNWIQINGDKRNEELIGKVVFEYKERLTETEWKQIPAKLTTHPNPAIEFPYLIQWDISDEKEYPEGEYQIRAVAYDKQLNPDSNPVGITVTIERNNPDKKEYLTSTGEWIIEENIDDRKTNKILGTGGSNAGTNSSNLLSKHDLAINSQTGLTQVIISSGSLNQTKDSVKLNTTPKLVHGPLAGLVALSDSYREISLLSKQTQLKKLMNVSISYNDTTPEDNLVDDTLTNVSELKMYVYTGTNWEECSEVSIDTITKTVTGKTTKTGQFALMTAISSTSFVNEFKTYCWPNPAKRDISQGTEMTLNIRCYIPSNISNTNIKIKIFSLAGELIKGLIEKDDIGTTMVNLAGNSFYDFVWNLKNDNSENVASGVYVYLVYLNDEPQKNQIKKVAIVR
jgi:hypothetical protein